MEDYIRSEEQMSRMKKTAASRAFQSTAVSPPDDILPDLLHFPL